jgi:uncharacterized membrane protein YraQ (UPF0718 family)
MNAITLPFYRRPLSCHYRPLILAITAATLFSVFWFSSRYPQLLEKSRHLGEVLPSMAFSHEALHVDANASAWRRILAGAINWFDSMKLGMSFGVLLGALLHTFLRYFPLKIGDNLYLNSLKGALVGIPAGICANCSVPTACGVTRGHGRVEVALGFLFSSPNFNPVVIMMTFTALPLNMALTKYAVLVLIIIGVVPALIAWLERDKPLTILTTNEESTACFLPASNDCTETFGAVLKELATDYAKNVWMLAKPTLTLMVLASIMSAALLTLLPWQELLSHATPLRLALVSLVSVFMPVPIALDVMFASQLYQQGVANGYVMLFAMTLGTYSIIPTIYLWREVSKPLSIILFAIFLVIGWGMGLIF